MLLCESSRAKCTTMHNRHQNAGFRNRNLKRIGETQASLARLARMRREPHARTEMRTQQHTLAICDSTNKTRYKCCKMERRWRSGRNCGRVAFRARGPDAGAMLNGDLFHARCRQNRHLRHWNPPAAATCCRRARRQHRHLQPVIHQLG